NGKKVRCPKCQEVFKVQLPEEDDLEVVDDLMDDFGAEDELPEEEPIEKKPSSKNKKGKKKKKGGGAKIPWAIIGIAAAVLLMLGGVVVVVAQFAGNVGTNKIDMTYLRPDANMVAHLKVKEMLDSPLLAGVMKTPAALQMLEMQSGESGVGANEMISLTVGARIDERLSDMNFPMGPAGRMNAPAETQKASHTVTVIRTSVPMKADEITTTKFKATPQTHNGKTYYKLGAVPANRFGIKPSPDRPDSVYFPEGTVMVMALEADIKQVIDQGSKQTRRREFDFINPGMTLLMAMALQLPGDPNAALKTPADQPQLQALERASNRTVRGGVAGVKITDRVDLEIIAKCADNAGAAEMKTALDGLFAHLKAQFEKTKTMLTLMDLNDVIALGDKSLASIKVEVAGAQVVALGTIPSDIKAVGESLSKKIPGMGGMGMGMPSPGMPPGFNGPPGSSGGLPAGFDASQIPPGTLPPGTVLPEGLPSGTLPPQAVPAGAVPPAGAPPP
ncbi:MAG: hypothetical protein JWN70_566, partial [Planctomycetaceae bacterium]|nr:hypothetical protein [Planctomycetaceae bacterium]